MHSLPSAPLNAIRLTNLVLIICHTQKHMVMVMVILNATKVGAIVFITIESLNQD